MNGTINVLQYWSHLRCAISCGIYRWLGSYLNNNKKVSKRVSESEPNHCQYVCRWSKRVSEFFNLRVLLSISHIEYVIVVVLLTICYVEFVLEHSPSVSICSRLFSALLSHSFLLFCPSPSPFVASVSVLCFRHFRLILSAFHIRIRPVLVSSDLAFILLLLLFGYNPYQPNPIAPRFLIVFCSLLSYDPFVPIVPICINYDKL